MFLLQKCPNTYAPVCGVPGMKAREPSLMFQNHCYMDVAQCKMNYEDIGPTAVSSGRFVKKKEMKNIHLFTMIQEYY